MSGVGFGAQSFGLIVCSLRIGDLWVRLQGLGFKVYSLVDYCPSGRGQSI